MATPTTLPGSFSALTPLSASTMNNLRGAFRVLQVVTSSYNVQTTNNTNVYADTGLSATITPQSSTSKILVYVSQNNMYKYTNANSSCILRLLRGATEIVQFANNWGFDGTTTGRIHGSCSVVWLDSPATTSATTYKTQFRNSPNAAGVNIQHDNIASTIALLEISA